VRDRGREEEEEEEEEERVVKRERGDILKYIFVRKLCRV